MANTSTHDTFGRHHRMGFPFNWISNLDTDPGGTRDPLMNMGVSQHDHMLISGNEIGVQHMIKTFAAELGVALD
ncbi:hypothetical protein ACIBG0_16255 [Nocardia sp. NPDC050630]|uniref:hypothetical protein n=1 Tax=Nocardia sp. NPDC050630 TaxID=3364321 RepID=UPI0037A3C711